ncbi:metal-sensing transcriptional repressor [Xanthomonas sp. MUS 060]|uniref:metal-sensing transcriptional repressor n=1 Tax=Xanthomonas sp. MUS 060 TaxID=1588031 RepID=UPI0009E52839|nr:metal-sensing transcriptional repressor [Xanthomonas sp. MUS 060]
MSTILREGHKVFGQSRRGDGCLELVRPASVHRSPARVWSSDHHRLRLHGGFCLLPARCRAGRSARCGQGSPFLFADRTDTIFSICFNVQSHATHLHERTCVLFPIRRARGQSEAVERALQGSSDCAPLPQQIAALCAAVGSLMASVMQAHVREALGHWRLRKLCLLVRSYLASSRVTGRIASVFQSGERP